MEEKRLQRFSWKALSSILPCSRSAHHLLHPIVVFRFMDAILREIIAPIFKPFIIPHTHIQVDVVRTLWPVVVCLISPYDYRILHFANSLPLVIKLSRTELSRIINRENGGESIIIEYGTRKLMVEKVIVQEAGLFVRLGVEEFVNTWQAPPG